jgi:hypothetical protein
MVLAAVAACDDRHPKEAPQISLPANVNPPFEVSVIGPIQPYNPGGPEIEITFKNVSDKQIYEFASAIYLNRDFSLGDFGDLLPGENVTAKRILPNGAFSDNVSYSLYIYGVSMQSAKRFSYTTQVQIQAP